MPAKRRQPKARAARPDAPPEAWALMFAVGHDYFNELRPYGVDPDNREQVAAAWAALGPAYLAQWPVLRDYYCPGLPDAQPWALLALGDPG